MSTTMVTKDDEAARAYSASVDSEHLQISSSEFWYQRLRDILMPLVIGSVDLGDDVLELGPGAGLSTELLRARVRALTAVELDGEMAATLSSRLAGTNVEVVHADATDLPFEDRRFTGVASFSFLHHMPTAELQDLLFGEVARVLQPGGVFAAYDGTASTQIANLHAGLPYNPVDPNTVEPRLLGAGFATVELQTLDLGWATIATMAA
jgi:SAM-dependent methyltransferase